MKKLIVLPLVAGLLATGCASTSALKSEQRMNVDTRSPLEIVAKESQKAVYAQQVYTKYKLKQNEIFTINNANFEEDKLVFNYIGKPQDMLKSIAIKYGYRFLEFGVPGDVPTVNFTNVYTTPQDALVILNSQLGESGAIGIDKSQKIISLTYSN